MTSHPRERETPIRPQEPIDFAKLSGSGNDFLCIDSRDGRFAPFLADPARYGPFARALCDRHQGVGGDGVIFACPVEPGVEADLAARFLEADGSEAELCGNGTAVFVHWASEGGWSSPAEVRVLTAAGVVRGQHVDDPYVRVCIPLPHGMERDQEVRAGGRTWNYDYVVTGVPHAVTYVKDLDRLDVPKWGRAIRRHERFAPRGANANFVEILGEGRAAIRTFEFGVEDETQACGTGCAAAAILATVRFGWPQAYRLGERPVLLRTRSGDTLRVYLTLDGNHGVTDLCLDTIVRFAFRGQLHPQLARIALGNGQ